MHNTSFLMQILQSLRNLQNYMPRKVFTEICKTDDLVEELATGAQLQDDVVVLSRFREVDETDDVRVVELPHYLDFFEDIRSLQKMTSVNDESRRSAKRKIC